MSNDNTPTVAAVPAAWQPIETAPTDGREALVYRPLAEKSGDTPLTIKRLIGGNRGCWDSTVPDGATPTNPTDGYCHTTHWMPLPAAPGAVAAVPAEPVAWAFEHSDGRITYHGALESMTAYRDTCVRQWPLYESAPPAAPAPAPVKPIAWTVAGEVRNWARDFSKYQTQHYVRPVYASPQFPAAEPSLTDALRAELVEDAREVFFADLLGTPQDIRDVIEYVDSWLQVYIQKRAESGAPAPAPQPLSDTQAQRLYQNLKPSEQQDARSLAAFKRLVRVVESAHGITGGATGGKP